MPHPNAINPATGRRYGWEAEQAKAKAESLDAVHQQIRLLKRQEKALKARDNLLDFVEFTSPHPEDPNDVGRSAYEPAAFHKAIARELERVESGEIPQLIFCMPPRHGKTRLATEALAAWYSGRHPDHDVAVAMATDLLATDVGGNVRNVMQTHQFKQTFPAHRMIRGGTAKDNIQTTQRGRLVFVGRGGTLNGRGASLLLVDDLYKDDQEAKSQVTRDQAWDWFVRVALRRRMNKKLVVLTMTRWHADDIIGRLTDPENPHYNEAEAKTWKIIRLPGLAEDDDPLGREKGEALWPERYDREYHLADQRRDPVGFMALTQQTPTVIDGILFKRELIPLYRPEDLPANLRIYCASDHAVGEKQKNDYSAFLKVGIDVEDNMWVLECLRARLPADRAVEAMLEMGTGVRAPLFWWAERGHISKSIGPFLHKRMLETNRYMQVVEVTPVSDKQTRAQSIIARAAMGKVRLPKDAIWTETLLAEMLAFPNGLHDDQVDALSLLGLGLRSQWGPGKSKKEREREQRPPTLTFAWAKQVQAVSEQEKARRYAGGF